MPYPSKRFARNSSLTHNNTRPPACLRAAYSPEGLEREPTRAVPPVAAFLVPPPGTVEPEFMSDEQRALVTQALDRLRARVSERKVSCAPVFKSFDKHNAGLVSRQQFAQALTMLELHTTPAETAALSALFGSDRGVNYRALLEAIAPEPDAPYRYSEFLATMRRLNAREKLPEKLTESPFEAVLEKLQRRVRSTAVLSRVAQVGARVTARQSTASLDAM